MALRRGISSKKNNDTNNNFTRITHNQDDNKIIESPDMMPDIPDEEEKENRFSLMENIIILGINDQLGYLSFWNDCISSGLRGAIIIELALLGRVEINSNQPKRYGLERSLIVLDDTTTGDSLLDESIRIIKGSSYENSVSQWIDLLTGETWNPLNVQYQIKNVRERISKSLADKGVLTNDKHAFMMFDFFTHPVSDISFKKHIIKRIQKALLSNEWGGGGGDPLKLPLKELSLIGLTYSSDVIDEVFVGLNESEYNTAFERLRKISSANINDIVQNIYDSKKQVDDDNKTLKQYHSSSEVIWTVLHALFNK